MGNDVFVGHPHSHSANQDASSTVLHTQHAHTHTHKHMRLFPKTRVHDRSEDDTECFVRMTAYMIPNVL